MPDIVVVDLGNVTVDGVSAGSVLDVAANYPNVEGIKSLTLAACLAWVASCDLAHTEALAAKDATIAELQAQIDTLGGTELAQQMAAEAKRQAALAKIAEAQAELDALGG